jgi:hypothetical protein
LCQVRSIKPKQATNQVTIKIMIMIIITLLLFYYVVLYYYMLIIFPQIVLHLTRIAGVGEEEQWQIG